MYLAFVTCKYAINVDTQQLVIYEAFVNNMIIPPTHHPPGVVNHVQLHVPVGATGTPL